MLLILEVVQVDFTQVLLENEVSSVTCVDVGSNQLHERIKHHPKITFFENTDIRNFQSEDIFELLLVMFLLSLF